MSIQWITTVFFILIFMLGCSKEEIKSNLLSDIIIGTWEKREQSGFPYSRPPEWHVFEIAELVVTFKKDGSVTFMDVGVADVETTYHVVASTNTIHYDSGISTWYVTEFDKYWFINEKESDEGITRHKYIKVK